MKVNMDLIPRYHDRRIKRLHEAHPEINLDVIRGDYFARLRGYGGMELFMPTSEGRTFEYDLALIFAVDESLPKRLERFISDVVYSLTNPQ